MRVFAIAVLAITCAVAQAQSVYRCDDGGRVTYSQMGCPRGSPRIVNTRPNSIDTSDAYEYNLRKIRQAEIKEELARRRAQEYADAGDIDAYACDRAKRELNMAKFRERNDRDHRIMGNVPPVSRGRHSAEVIRAGIKADAACGTRQFSTRVTPRPSEDPSPPPAPPSVLVNCDPAGCWDTNGKRYDNAAGGGNFTRSDGKFCTGSGATLICN